jgi:CCR4-NOT transcription complex subunit 3
MDLAKPPPNPNFAQQPMSSILKAGLPPAPRPPVTLPPIRYAAAAAAAVSSTSPATMGPSTPTAQATSNVLTTPAPVPTAPSIAPSISQSMLESQLLSSPSLTHPSVTSPMLSSASASFQPDGSFYSGQDSPAISEAVPSSVSGPPASSSPQRTTLHKGMLRDPTCWILGKNIYRACDVAYVAKGCFPCCPSTFFIIHLFRTGGN